jgi:hypothetical protein
VRERDQRDDLTWVVLELTDAGERLAEEGGLDAHLRSVLDCPEDHPIFVPYTVIIRHKRRSVINVIEGYAFVATGLPDTTYFGLGNKSPNIKTVLSQNRSGVGRVLTPVPNRSVLDLQTRLRQMISREIEINSEVRVHDGLHRGLVGKVIDVHGDDAFVLIKMRTIETVRVFPRYSLRPADGVLGFDSPSDVYPNYLDQEEMADPLDRGDDDE